MKTVNGKTLLENLEKVLRLKADKSSALFSKVGINLDSDSLDMAGVIGDNIVFIGQPDFDNMKYIRYDDAKNLVKLLKTMKNKNGFDVNIYLDEYFIAENPNNKSNCCLSYANNNHSNHSAILHTTFELFNKLEQCGKIESDEVKGFCSLAKFTNKKTDKKTLKKSLHYIYGKGNNFYATDLYIMRKIETKNEQKDLFVHHTVADALAKGKEEIVFSMAEYKNSKWYFAKQGDMTIAYSIDKKMSYPDAERLYQGYRDVEKRGIISNGKLFKENLELIKSVSEKVDGAYLAKIDWQNSTMSDKDKNNVNDMSRFYMNEKDSMNFKATFNVALLKNIFDINNEAEIYMRNNLSCLFVDYMNGVIDIYLPIRCYDE